MDKLKNIRVFITGATGYIGSRLTSRLVKEGSIVHVLIRPTSNKQGLKDVLNDIEEHVYDGTYESIDRAICLSRPDIVFHLSSFASIRYQTEDVPSMLESNIILGTFLAEAMSKYGMNRLVNTSSFSQHVGQERYNPNSLYAATKQAYEDLLLYYSNYSFLNTVTLVLFDNYGPRDPRPKLMNLIYRALVEKTTLLLSPGEQFMDLLYIDDVINAYLVASAHLLDDNVRGYERYSVGSKKRIQLMKLIPLVEKISEKKIRVKWGALDYRPGEIMVPWQNGSPLPGWEQSISLEQGIEMFLKENNRVYKNG